MFAIRQSLITLVYFIASTKVKPSTGFGHSLRHHHSATALVDSGIHKSRFNLRQLQLLSRKSSAENDSEDEMTKTKTAESPDVIALMDPGLWASDFLALILASQLLGLLNVINSPEFIANGGWFQPIPAVPSTLDELVQRISSFGIAWALASASVVFLAKATAKDSLQQAPLDDSETSVILKRNAQTLVIFGLLLLLGNGIAFGFEGTTILTNTGQNNVNPWLDALRNCYYVGLSTFGLRFLYGRYFLLS